jgi:biopolymer transport protein ExbD
MSSKSRKQEKKHRSGTIPTDSFSDIAFLLIIYFLVATSLVKVKSITADLPSGEKAAQAQTEKTPSVNLRGSEIFFNDKQVNL